MPLLDRHQASHSEATSREGARKFALPSIPDHYGVYQDVALALTCGPPTGTRLVQRVLGSRTLQLRHPKQRMEPNAGSGKCFRAAGLAIDDAQRIGDYRTKAPEGFGRLHDLTA